MKLSVIIPVFNEEKTIKELISKVLEEKTPKEIIIVDDGSSDGTRRILSEYERNNKVSKLEAVALKVVLHDKNRGKGAAIRTGISYATGSALIIQDADLEYNPKDYSKLLKPILKKQSKVVYGTRLKEMKLILFGKNRSPLPLHYIANRSLSLLTNVIYGSNLTDMETCYKMISREVYSNLELVGNRFEIEPEITAKILKAGHSILEVPIKVKPRGYKEGKKIKARDTFIAVWTLLKYRLG